MENSTRELFPQSDSYNASSDALFFSTSLPVLGHENFNVNELTTHENLSLLPNEDEFLQGMVDELVADTEECDVFASGGPLELGPDFQETLRVGVSCLNLTDRDSGNGNKGAALSFASGEHPLGEHPSRTLFVRNISSNVEDAEIRSLFEQYGDIREMHTACKHRGFVMISYYDIRAARKAMRSLQDKPLHRRNLDIHFSIPKETPTDKEINQGTLVALNLDPSVSNDDLHKIFGPFGEVKEIRETPHKRYHKFIEFYDVRAAERALKSLNRSDIAGKRIKLEPSRPGGIRRSLLLNPYGGDLEQDEGNPNHIGSLLGFSPPGNWAHLSSSSSMDQNPPKNYSKSPVFGAIGPPPFGNNVPGLAASVLNQPIDKNGPPIRKHNLDPIFANGGSLKNFQHSHSFPHQNLSNVGHSDFNGSISKPLCGPHQLLWGNNGLNFLDHFRAPKMWAPPALMGTNGPFVGPASYNNRSFGRNSVMDSQSRVFGMPSISPIPMIFGNGHQASNMGGGSSFRAFEAKGIQSDNKGQFLIYLDKITSGEDTRTTLMIKNIPNKYTTKMLMAAIDKHYKGTYDFLYLPIDFKNKCNVGYAFINMLSPLSIIPFYKEFIGKKWEKFNSDKIVSLAFARIQGKAALMAHFQKSSLMNEDKGFRPIIINSEGTEFNDTIKKIVPENLHT